MALFKTQKTLAPKRGFSLVELLVVITIVGILGAVSFVAIQRTKTRSLNERMLDDLVAVANALEDYRQDHQGTFPIPTVADNQNVLCFYADATYADCDDTDVSFIQGMIDNNLLTKRYLREVPTDPRTGSRYVYGVSENGKYYQVAGLYEASAGFEARTVGNLAKGFELPSLIRAYDGPNFVVDGEENLPYPSDRLSLTGTLDNKSGDVKVGTSQANAVPVNNGKVVHQGDIIFTGADGSADLYLSDGSTVHIDPLTEMELKSLATDKNDSQGTVTKILLKLNLGKIWSKVARLANASEFRVETSSSIAGVRGTEFGVEEFGGATPWKIRVKSGKVWGGKKADLASTLGVQNLAVEDTSPEVVFAMPKPELSSSLIYTDPANILDPADAADAAYYAPYYASIPLTSNHRPHILSVAPVAQGHSVTVRNVNFAANLANRAMERKLEISQNLADGALAGTIVRSVKVTRLAAYDASTIDSANPTPITATGDISAQQTGIYTLNITSSLPLVLRFELLDNLNNVIRSSSTAPLPPLTSGTNLTEAQLYPNLAPSVEGLEITAPDTVALTAAGSAQTFAVGGSVQGFTLSATGPCTAAASVSGYVVTYSQAGTCVLTATATLSNGATATATKTVTIAPATAVLSLGQPVYSDVGPKRFATIPWSASNPPLGALFASKLNSSTQQTVPSPMKFEVAPGTQYVVWLIMYRDTSGNGGYNAGVDEELETASVQFTVPSGSNPSADFTINPPIPQPVSGNAITTFNFSAPQVPVAIDTNLYDYVWAGATSTVATPQYATLELQVPQAGATATGTVTLTIRDKANRNVLATQTKSVSVNRLSEVTQIVYKNSLGNEMTSANPETVQKPGTLNLASNYSVHIKALNGVNLASTLPISSPACDYSIDPNNTGSFMSASGQYDTANSTTEGTDTLRCRLTQAPAGYVLPSVAPIANLWVAVTAPVVATRCGDGVIQSPNSAGVVEACDDGNTAATDDGCSASCSLTQNPDYICQTGISPYSALSPQTVCTLTLEAKCVGTSSSIGRTTLAAGGSKNTTLGTYFQTSDSSCWALGAAGLNCTDACNALDNSSSGVDMSCVAADWNDCGANGACGAQSADADDCEICKLFTGATSCSYEIFGFDPINIITSSGTNFCKYRQSATQDCGTIPSTTFQGATAKRICKCQ